MTPRSRAFVVPLVALLLMGSIGAACAAGALDTIKDDYAARTVAWSGTAMQIAREIFAGLIVTEIVWSLIEIFLGTRDLEAFIASLTMRIIRIGVAVTILSIAGPVLLGALSDFSQIGARIGGAQFATFSPNQVLALGLDLGNKIPAPPTWNVAAWSAASIAAIASHFALIIAFAIAAAALLLCWIEAFIVVGAGAFLLGFIGSRWTLPWAERYVGMVLTVCVKLLVINLLVGLGASISTAITASYADLAVSGGTAPSDFFAPIADAIVFVLIVWNVPGFVAGMVGGAPVLSAAGALASARGAAGAVSGAASGAAGAGRAAAGAASSRIAQAASVSRGR